MDRAALYREQAAYCAYLLNRVLDPARRTLLERERQDWLLLADQHELWLEIAEREPQAARDAVATLPERQVLSVSGRSSAV